MGIYVNPNEALLKRAVNSKIYVDKSTILHELNQLLNTEDCFVCVASIFDSYLLFLNGMFKNADIAPAFALVYLTGFFPIVRDKIQSNIRAKSSGI